MDFKQIGIVGAGLVGAGLAQICAFAARDVVLHDPDVAALQEANRAVDLSFARMLAKKELRFIDARVISERIHYSTNLDTLGSCDLIIHTMYEDEELQRDILSKRWVKVRKDTVIGIRTSETVIAKFATRLLNSGQVIDLHFVDSSPEPEWIELILGDQTAKETYLSTAGFTKNLSEIALAINGRMISTLSIAVTPIQMQQHV